MVPRLHNFMGPPMSKLLYVALQIVLFYLLLGSGVPVNLGHQSYGNHLSCS